MKNPFKNLQYGYFLKIGKFAIRKNFVGNVSWGFAYGDSFYFWKIVFEWDRKD